LLLLLFLLKQQHLLLLLLLLLLHLDLHLVLLNLLLEVKLPELVLLMFDERTLLGGYRTRGAVRTGRSGLSSGLAP
jgi:hypothetical protein